MQRGQNGDASSDELKSMLNSTAKELKETEACFYKGLIESLTTLLDVVKKKKQEEYLQTNNMDYVNNEGQILADVHHLVDVIKSENSKEKINEAISHFKEKWPAFNVFVHQEVEIKKASKLQYLVTKNDVEQAFLKVEFIDLFDKFNFPYLIEIDKNRIEEPIESLMAVSFKRVDQAREEQRKEQQRQREEFEKSFSYQAISFFRRHPYVSAAGVALASAAVTGAAIVGALEVRKGMGV